MQAFGLQKKNFTVGKLNFVGRRPAKHLKKIPLQNTVKANLIKTKRSQFFHFLFQIFIVIVLLRNKSYPKKTQSKCKKKLVAGIPHP